MLKLLLEQVQVRRLAGKTIPILSEHHRDALALH
jgi:hypothetical protein